MMDLKEKLVHCEGSGIHRCGTLTVRLRRDFLKEEGVLERSNAGSRKRD